MHDFYENLYNDYLIHYGVKGMKWGIRKKRNKNVDDRSVNKKNLNTNAFRKNTNFLTKGKLFVNKNLYKHKNVEINNDIYKSYTDTGKKKVNDLLIVAASSAIGNTISSIIAIKSEKSPIERMIISQLGSNLGKIVGAAVVQNIRNKR